MNKRIEQIEENCITVGAYALNHKEQKEVISELRNLDFHFTLVEADEVRARKKGQYKEIMEIWNALKKLNWTWE